MPAFAMLRRRRKAFAKVCLAAWLFVLGMGLAYACGWHADSHHEAELAASGVPASDHEDSVPPGCEDACKDQAAVVSKLQLVQDPPSGHPLLLPSLVAVPASQGVARLDRAASERPPPGLPVSIRFLRLHL
jgi:hypothetical protein